MNHEQENNKHHIPDIKIRCLSCGSVIFDSTLRYTDKWGETWYRESLDYIRRVSDGCVGGWFDGKELTLTT